MEIFSQKKVPFFWSGLLCSSRAQKSFRQSICLAKNPAYHAAEGDPAYPVNF
jgi:hypothetical protein